MNEPHHHKSRIQGCLTDVGFVSVTPFVMEATKSYMSHRRFKCGNVTSLVTPHEVILARKQGETYIHLGVVPTREIGNLQVCLDKVLDSLSGRI